MSQLRFYPLDEDEVCESNFDTIVLDEQLVNELEDDRLSQEEISLNDLASWSCNEIFTHDYSPSTSRSLNFASGIDLEPKVISSFGCLDNANVSEDESEEVLNCVSSNGACVATKSVSRKKPRRKKATVVQCEYCGVMIKHPSKIQAHLRTHTGEKPFQCFICGMRFTQRTPMRMHVRRHLNETPFICSFGCGKSYVSNALKNAHEVKAHLKEQRKGLPKPHLKPLKRSVTAVSALSLKMRPEIQASQHVSNDVLRNTSTSAASEKLDEVINAVAAGIPLVPPKKVRRRTAIIAECGECGLVLKHPSKIKAHMRVHTGERPYECQFCSMRFATANPLRVHLRRVHTGEKPYECTWDCGRRFVSISARNEHERVVHAGLKRYQCTIDNCRRLFTRRHYLRLHHSKDHNVKDDGTNFPDRCTSFRRSKQSTNDKLADSIAPVTLMTVNRCYLKTPPKQGEPTRLGSGVSEEYFPVENEAVTDEVSSEVYEYEAPGDSFRNEGETVFFDDMNAELGTVHPFIIANNHSLDDGVVVSQFIEATGGSNAKRLQQVTLSLDQIVEK